MNVARPTPATPISFSEALARAGVPALRRGAVDTIQINVGKVCNQACRHCHVDAGPRRAEAMDARTARRLLELLEGSATVRTVDVTGGAPELNPSFRALVRGARDLGLAVMDRCNLTILLEPGQEDLVAFLAEHRVHVVASLPCYSAANVDHQRGKGVFGRSIEGLRRLNDAGFGQPDSPLRLDLVYNPIGPTLPPAQGGLEAAYKRQLAEHFGIAFHRLLTITNMPIARFGAALRRRGEHERYLALLRDSFNPATVDGLMCRDLVSVSWDGRLFDCDFNQMLELPVPASGARTIWDIEGFDALARRPIATGEHCFGCTAGAGSSCGGALTG